MSNKPPKIVIPGLNRGAGIPPGFVLGRLPGTGQGPAQLLPTAQLQKLGIATTAATTGAISQSISVVQSEIVSLSTAVSSSISTDASKITSLSTAVSAVDRSQSTSLSQISSSLSGAISSASSLSAGVSTVVSGSISAVNSRVDSLSTAVGGGGSPGGSSGQIQYNNAGAFGGFTMSGDVTTNTATGVATIKTDVALAGNPTTTTQAAGDNSTKIATDAFVTTAINNAIAGVNPAVAVQAATTAAGDTSAYTYNNGVGGVGATLTGPAANVAVTADGYTFTALGQRLLVKNDTQSPSGAFNGVYYVTTLQAIGIKPVLTRALDYNQPSDINNTGAIPVVNGTVNALTSWLLTSQVTTVGTDPLTYTQFSVNPTATQTANTLFAGPTTGSAAAPTFRAMVTADIPPISDLTLNTGMRGIGPYLMSAFRNSDMKLYLTGSNDGVTWGEVGSAIYTPPSDSLRDPSWVQYNGTYWVAYTNPPAGNILGTVTHFSVASSPDLTTWTHVADPSTTAISGVVHTWAPEWFVDSDDSIHVFFAANTSASATAGFQLYEMHPTNAGMTTWSSPVLVTGTSLPSTIIDPCMVKIGSTYYLWFKNQTNNFLGYMTSSSLTSGYTVVQSGSTDWMGLGFQSEGPSLMQPDSSTWRLYTDRYTDIGVYYTESTNTFSTWSAPALITPPNAILAHGSVAKMTTATQALNLMAANVQHLQNAMTMISSVVVSGTLASQTFSNIPQIYRDLRVVVRGRTDAAAQEFRNCQFQVNGDTGANYNEQYVQNFNSVASVLQTGQTSWTPGFLPAATATANWAGACEITILNYTDTTFYKVMKGSGVFFGSTASGHIGTREGFGQWSSLTAVNSVKIFPQSGNFLGGTVIELYGRM